VTGILLVLIPTAFLSLKTVIGEINKQFFLSIYASGTVQTTSWKEWLFGITNPITDGFSVLSSVYYVVIQGLVLGGFLIVLIGLLWLYRSRKSQGKTLGGVAISLSIYIGLSTFVSLLLLVQESLNASNLPEFLKISVEYILILLYAPQNMVAGFVLSAFYVLPLGFLTFFLFFRSRVE
jgi:hypothetical protein